MKKLILAVSLLASFASQATMIRSVVVQGVLEAGVSCVVMQGKSKNVPLTYLHKLFEEKRNDTTPEGDTLEPYTFKLFDQNFVATAGIMEEANKKNEPIDCKKYMGYVQDYLNKNLADGEMTNAANFDQKMDSVLLAASKIDEIIFSEFQRDQEEGK